MFFIFMHIVSAIDYHKKHKGDYIITEVSDTNQSAIGDDALERYNALIDQYNKYIDELSSVQEFYAAKSANLQVNSEIVSKLDTLLEQWNNNAQNVSKHSKVYEKSTVFGPKETAFQEMRKCVNKAPLILNEIKNAYEQSLFAEKTTEESPKSQSSSFFNGCDTLEKLTKRYKSLAKAYHPDTEIGDTETMKQINNEYEHLKQELSQNAQ